jgi:Short C-terminal domain
MDARLRRLIEKETMMLMRPVARVGRPGLVGVAARTAVVAGTATAVAGGVARHQANKQEQAAEAAGYEQQQAQPAPAYAPPPAAADTGVSDDTVAQLERLGKLKQEGILTDEEFAAQKAKLLGM